MNIAEILKNCPKGMKLYSPMWGDVEFSRVKPSNYIEITVLNSNNFINTLYPDGRYTKGGECMLFPSKEQRDWNEFLFPFKDGDKEGRYELNDGSCLFFKDQDDYEIAKFNTSMVKELEFVKLAGIWFVELPDYDGDPWDLEMVAGADTLCDILAKNGRVKVSLATDLDDLDPICAPDYTLDFINSTVSNGLQDGANYKVRELDLDIRLCNVTKYVFGEFPTTIYISLL